MLSFTAVSNDCENKTPPSRVCETCLLHPPTPPPRLSSLFILPLPRKTIDQADPNNIDLHEGLAALCVDSGLPEEAAACYRRCLELHAAAAVAATPQEPEKKISAGSGLMDGASVDEAAGAARTDRWSVALFKCNASLCQWGDWDAEALALRTAVRRRQRRRQGEQRGEGKSAERSGGTSRLSSTAGRGPDGEDGRRDLIRSLLLGYDGEDVDDVGSFSDCWTPRNQQQRRGGDDHDGVEGGCTDAPLSRPALHPFDSLSAPLSIGDCLAVAQQQSLGVLAGARKERGVESVRERAPEKGAATRPRHQRQRWERPTLPSLSSLSRDARGRIRLGYVSGDLMGTHPLTHLMQASERARARLACVCMGGIIRRRIDRQTMQAQDEKVEDVRALLLLRAEKQRLSASVFARTYSLLT